MKPILHSTKKVIQLINIHKVTISDKIIGGIRGKRRHEIANLVKLFDNYLNKKKIIQPTNYMIVAKKT